MYLVFWNDSESNDLYHLQYKQTKTELNEFVDSLFEKGVTGDKIFVFPSESNPVKPETVRG